MKICAIICEYNPLHNSHAMQIATAKQITNCDLLVCLMSGNYVQRGEPAIFDKYTRSRHAIFAGADAVIELPIFSAIGSADDFALGAMRILKALNVAAICFGCENDSLLQLQQTADILYNENIDTSNIIKQSLSNGNNYATAVAQTLSTIDCNILNKPNNLLAVSYIKAAKKLNFETEFYPIKRLGDYNDTSISSAHPSASAIRNAINLGFDVSNTIPHYVYNDIKNFLPQREYERFVHLYLQTLTADSLSNIYGVSEGIQNRIEKCKKASDYTSFFASLKTKRYTRLKLNRILLNAVLNITNNVQNEYKSIPPYSRLLAIKKINVTALMPIFAACSLLNSPPSSLNIIENNANNLYWALSPKSEKSNNNISKYIY
ncbi:MAG: nucleotidyltransferase family protein [Clostridia bacterium]